MTYGHPFSHTSIRKPTQAVLLTDTQARRELGNQRDPAALAADLRAIVGRTGGDATIEQVMTMETRLSRSLARPRLYGIEPLVVTFAVVGGAFLLVAIVACANPARRAARIDPISALRR